MRLAADSVTSADIPAGRFPIVLGYVDGKYAWSEQDWLRHTQAGALAVGIAVNPATDAGTILDVETGDATPYQAPAWVQMRRAAGVDPTVYCGQFSLPAVSAAFKAQGVPEPHYLVANYDNSPVIPAGCIGKQYANAPLTGGHYDLSVVADFWPGVDPAPQQEDDMQGIIVTGSNGEDWAVLPSGYRFGVASQADLAQLKASGQFVQVGSVSDGQLQQWPVLGQGGAGTVPQHSHGVTGTAQ